MFVVPQWQFFSVCSFNMHGFNQGHHYLADLCVAQCHDVIMIQEHWLLEQDIYKIRNVDANYVCIASSAMGNASAKGVLKGRPFGGIGVLINKHFAHLLKCTKIEERFLIIQLGNTLFINVYFPVCKDKATYEVEMEDLLTMIGQVIESSKAQNVIMGGDFNFDLTRVHPGCPPMFDFMWNNKLASCRDFFDDSVPYTYRHESLGVQSFIDNFVISSELVKKVVCCEVLDSGTNLSDHCAIQLMVELSVATHKHVRPNHQPIRTRLRWDKANKDNYYAETYLYLHAVDMSFMKNCDGKCNGACNVHIEAVYDQVVKALNRAAASTVPKTPQKFYKFWWDEHLSDLKRRSLDAHTLWVASGRPGRGDIYDNKRCAKAKYKRAIREKDKGDAQGLSNELNDYLLSKDQEGFWKVWRSKFCKVRQTEFIDGTNDPVSVADLFATHFENACAHNSVDRSFVLLKEFLSQYDEYTGDVDCDCHIPVELVDRCLHSMKLQKAAGLDGIESEHIVFAHPVVVLLLSELFSCMIRHAYVPSGFCSGIVIPVPKDKSGDQMDSNNYRGITLSSNISKLFELCLLDRYSCYLTSSDLQFGFKKKLGCNNAIYALRSVVDYYTSRGSTINLCTLDVAKAFDKVNHYGLYLKLMKRRVPKCFLNLLINWYSRCVAVVRWNDVFSRLIHITCGVRQGGVLSPVLFALYVDDIANSLSSSKLGCYVGEMYVGCIMYADDIILLSASLNMLQRMIVICETEAYYLDMKFNVTKSMILRVGYGCNVLCAKVYLDSCVLQFVCKLKYLGVFLLGGKKLRLSLQESKAKFFKALNGILYRVKNFSHDMVILQLIRSYCKPILLYACECFDMSHSEIMQLCRAWKCVYWKVFKVSTDDAIACIQAHIGFSDLDSEIRSRKSSFICKMCHSCNTIIKRLSTLNL